MNPFGEYAGDAGYDTRVIPSDEAPMTRRSNRGHFDLMGMFDSVAR